jgi:hypothetical protein
MRSQATILALLVSSVSAFWRMPCRSQTGHGRIDPIVDPGDISAHVHTIHGGGGKSQPSELLPHEAHMTDINVGFGFSATYDTLTASNCMSHPILERGRTSTDARQAPHARLLKIIQLTGPRRSISCTAMVLR